MAGGNTRWIKRILSTFHPIRIGPRWTGWAGGCVIVIETGVTGGAGLSFSTWRQRLCSSHTLKTDLWLHPLIYDLGLKWCRKWKVMEKSRNCDYKMRFLRMFNLNGGLFFFPSPFPHDHKLCGSGSSLSWNMEVFPYTQLIRQLEKQIERKIKITFLKEAIK